MADASKELEFLREEEVTVVWNQQGGVGGDDYQTFRPSNTWHKGEKHRSTSESCRRNSGLRNQMVST